MDSSYGNTFKFTDYLCRYSPVAIAELKGSPEYPNIDGIAYFYKIPIGVIVATEVSGLPFTEGNCNGDIFAFHIHNGESCTGNNEDPFLNAGTHYNPSGCPHPSHAGDLPPLFGNRGYAWSAVFTNRFTVDEVLGKVVIIHRMPDDFTTQPSGNSGEKIACGVIR